MNSFLAVFIRHGLAAMAGFLAEQGIHADVSSTVSLVGASLFFVISCSWSWFAKKPMAEKSATNLQLILGIFAQQLIAGLAGWLQASGYAVDAADPTAVILFGSNLAVSKVKGVKLNPTTGQWLLVPLCFVLIGCVGADSSVRQIFMAELAVEAGQLTLDVARMELAKRNANPMTSVYERMATQLVVTQAQKRVDNERARLDMLMARQRDASLFPPVAAPVTATK
ncbi:MAG: hypothetical protein V4662_25045 [Verrucomicrobiota bacterium]